MDFSFLVSEDKIKKAYKDGEFNHLPGFGKPLPKDSLASVPEELRMAYRVLKNAGYSLEEDKIRQELLSMEDLIRSCETEEEKLVLQRKYNEKLLRFRIMMKERTAGSHSQPFSGYQKKVENKFFPK
ncbi:DUF1992 domain-containing protein [Niallia circulans]|uniref:DnaJ family domain-containing protein n=1 Tax=Niallia TaxID=2837506 RepID=UPI001560A762|nr:DUF1992 domain-containing protein [Niallia circulans]NRG34231.1 DUF1992 domain-containing protein [Niallia circulans]